MNKKGTVPTMALRDYATALLGGIATAAVFAGLTIIVFLGG